MLRGILLVVWQNLAGLCELSLSRTDGGSSMRVRASLLATLASVALVSACSGGGSAASADPSPLKAAYDACLPKLKDALDTASALATEIFKYGSDGSLIVGMPETNQVTAVAAVTVLGCALNQLDAPDATKSKIEGAIRTGGGVEEEWNGVKATVTSDGNTLSAVLTVNS